VFQTFDHPVLGTVTWLADHKWWRFKSRLPGGRTVTGTIVPADEQLPLQNQGLSEIAASVSWVFENEDELRRRITERMFVDWLEGHYDPTIHTVTTPEAFCATLSLQGFMFLENLRATVIYDDGELFGGHAVVADLRADGTFECDPHIWG